MLAATGASEETLLENAEVFADGEAHCICDMGYGGADCAELLMPPISDPCIPQQVLNCQSKFLLLDFRFAVTTITATHFRSWSPASATSPTRPSVTRTRPTRSRGPST